MDLDLDDLPVAGETEQPKLSRASCGSPSVSWLPARRAGSR
jgi:hypothetical protein